MRNAARTSCYAQLVTLNSEGALFIFMKLWFDKSCMKMIVQKMKKSRYCEKATNFEKILEFFDVFSLKDRTC